ncbi:class I SAM-dependent methyltransferase [Ectothiorhodospiraceae bacterium 2226]|nr:class I SAM-dependent methyltransferase [Ectothiorhodospiraceae bacterium 2226]
MSLSWNERYAEPGYAYGTEPNTFVVSVADRIPPGPVLSLGEGEGRNAVYLAGRGHDVTAVDASDVGLAKARQLAAEAGVTVATEVADLADFELGEGAWSAIVSIFCHVPPPVRRRVHGALARALAPGGLFVFEAYGPEQLQHGTGGPRDLAFLPDLDTLLAELGDLEIVSAQALEREVREGRYHTGPGAVIQILARRAP